MAHSPMPGRLAAVAGIALGVLLALLGGTARGDQTMGMQRFSIFDVGVTLTGEWAGETGDGKTQKAEIRLEPVVEMRLPGGARLTAIGRIRGDLKDRLEPGRPDQDEISGLSRRHAVGDRGDYELRELRLTADIGSTMLTLGKQQIVWGTADGLKVLDVLNPEDLREFILPEFADSRIPLWAANIEQPVGPVVLQVVWIPDQTYHDAPAAGAAYALTAPRFVPSIAAVPLPAERPDRVLADSDAGARLSTFVGGWDLTLNYFFHYDDMSVPFRSTAGGATYLTPRYNRTHLIGGTAANSFGSFTVRGEVGYSTRRNLLTDDPADADGVTRSGELGYVLGLDWTGVDDTLVSAQLFQSWLPGHRAGVVRDELDTTATLLVRHNLRNNTLVGEVMWLQNLNDGDGLARPKITYQLSDHAKLWAGADIFYGQETGVFGQFDDRDRVILGLEFSY